MTDFDFDARSARPDFDLDELLHPAQAFSDPAEVVADPDLTLNEKRAILASWASDACAVDSCPALRDPGAGRPPVGFNEVMDALRALDKQASDWARACVIDVIRGVTASSGGGAGMAVTDLRRFRRRSST